MCSDCFLLAVICLDFLSKVIQIKNTKDVSKETCKVGGLAGHVVPTVPMYTSLSHTHPSYLGQRAQLE